MQTTTLSKVYAAANAGFDSQPVEVECDMTNGLPSLIVVGLANKAIDEAKERVRGAVKNSGLTMPRKHITLNLAPADMPKDGTAYDLAMAIAILATSGQVGNDYLSQTLFVGELALDGTLRSIPGVLRYAQMAKLLGFERIFVPEVCAAEAALVRDIDIYGAPNLRRVYQHLVKEKSLDTHIPQELTMDTTVTHDNDMAQIYGQEQAKRAIEIAAAGNHNLLLTGPPGAGKTMLARTILSMLPAPSFEEIIEITKMHSLGNIDRGVVTGRPFRSPHHTSSDVALIGGGQNPRPGEISLAHNGVLFLDELPEFKRSVLEVLRQPLEDKVVTVSRAARSATYPARFMMIATQNPCPCGFADDPIRDCGCTQAQIVRYTKKISGPLLDRIDLVVHVQRVEHDKLLAHTASESSETIAHRVKKARAKQFDRFTSSTKTNSDMNNKDIRQYSVLDKPARQLMEQAMKSLDLSARSYMRILKFARTIADLQDSETVAVPHLTEALQYRARR